jgi:hypothetical protein
MSLANAMASKRKLRAEDVEAVVKLNNQRDYMLLNYMEQEIIRQHGQKFLVESGNKIQYIIGFILNSDMPGLFTMYNECFDIYMNSCNHNIDYVNSFNIVFLVLIHVSMKIIRKNKTESEGST